LSIGLAKVVIGRDHEHPGKIVKEVFFAESVQHLNET
jgi:hypothetical protein